MVVMYLVIPMMIYIDLQAFRYSSPGSDVGLSLSGSDIRVDGDISQGDISTTSNIVSSLTIQRTSCFN